ETFGQIGKCPNPDGVVSVRTGLSRASERRLFCGHPPASKVVKKSVRADNGKPSLRRVDQANGREYQEREIHGRGDRRASRRRNKSWHRPKTHGAARQRSRQARQRAYRV